MFVMNSTLHPSDDEPDDHYDHDDDRYNNTDEDGHPIIDELFRVPGVYHIDGVGIGDLGWDHHDLHPCSDVAMTVRNVDGDAVPTWLQLPGAPLEGP